jgi:CHAT domain-containing protein
VGGAATRSAARARRAHAVDAQKASELERELRAAVDEVSRAASDAPPPEGDEASQQAQRSARSERYARAVREKEQLERALLELAARAGGIDEAAIAVPDLAAALPERSAAAAIAGYVHASPDPERSGRTIAQARLAALVLDREARVRFVPLAPSDEVQSAIEALRSATTGHATRGLPPRTAATGDADAAAAAAARLRDRVVAPLLSACGSIDTLYLAVDDLLELVPLDALPLDGERLVGERIALRPLVSLFDLLDPPQATTRDAAGLLIGGGIDYGRAADDAGASVDPQAASPILERAGEAGGWTPLPGSAREATEIAELFAQAFPAGTTALLAGTRAGKALVARTAPQATFVHLATHGYFAPERVRSAAAASANHGAFADGAITGLSPLVLCGLALSGANLPPDGLGRHAGVLTAEEILALDLSDCYLVTLSACDTSLGVRRAGQGYASLRAALQGAGARHVLTSLWKVGDEATRAVMVDFYRCLWVEKLQPHAALWSAKIAAHRAGAPFRDWAGWILTGL